MSILLNLLNLRLASVPKKWTNCRILVFRFVEISIVKFQVLSCTKRIWIITDSIVMMR